MIKHLLKHEYSKLKASDYKKALDFIDGKCSQYYFLDYMRCANGDVDDAIEFYLLDDKLRSLLTQYLIRFEIQIKTDFVQKVQDSTHSSSFWKHRKYYIEEARHPGKKGNISNFTRMKRHIESNMNRMAFSTIGPINYAAMYSSSFGTFQELFKFIDLPYKDSFIQIYTSHLKVHSYKILNTYLESIRRIRNRCAHGNHIISLKMVNDLNSLRSTMFNCDATPNSNFHLTVMEATIIFIIKQLNCGEEFKNRLISLLSKYEDILTKYNGKHSLSSKTIAKII